MSAILVDYLSACYAVASAFGLSGHNAVALTILLAYTPALALMSAFAIAGHVADRRALRRARIQYRAQRARIARDYGITIRG